MKYLQLKNWKRISLHLTGCLVMLLICGYGILKVLDYCYPFPTAMLDNLKQERASSIIMDRDGQVLRPFLSSQDNWLLWHDAAGRPVATTKCTSYLQSLAIFGHLSKPKGGSQNIICNSASVATQERSLKRHLPSGATRCQYLRQAFIAAEDRRFYQHDGIDYIATGRALATNIFYMRRVSGASTLTMQLMRMAMQHHRRTLTHKLIELFRAWQCEQLYSKDDIMNYYLNLAPFGSNIYGVTAASKIFFDKTPEELTLAQAALLAGLVQAPSRYLPYRHPELAQRRRNTVLYRMFKNSFITRQQWLLAYKTPVVASRNALPFRSPHLALLLAPQNGRKIITTIDAKIQQLARYKLRSAVRAKGNINGAIIVVENSTGAVRAFIGSAGFKTSQHGEVNYATRRLNTGSLLKPFIYLQAFQRGFALPSTIIDDRSRQFSSYTPRNFDQQWHGKVTAREALAYSYNIPAVAMLQQVGLDNFVNLMLNLDCAPLPHSPEHYGLSMALGSVPYSLLDMTQAYLTLARLGDKIPLRYETASASPKHRTALACNQSTQKKHAKAVNSDKTSQSHQLVVINTKVDNNASFCTGTAQATINKSAAYLICDILKDQTRLAGRKLTADSSKQVKFAWKTGTSNQYREAWTIAWNPQWTVGVMLTANLPNSTVKLIGLKDAAPLAANIIREISVNHNQWYYKPATVTQREICAITGLLPSGNCMQRINALSIRGRALTKYCQCKTSAKTTAQIVAKKPANITITQPINGTTYLSSNIDKNIICMATATMKKANLFWFADGVFIGKTNSGDSMQHNFTSGSHRLTCSTTTGQQSSVNFTIKH